MAYDYPEPTGDRMMPMASVQADALETSLPDSFVKQAEKKIADYGAEKMQPQAPAYAPMASEGSSLEKLKAMGEEEDIY